jgi:hypothetical protein
MVPLVLLAVIASTAAPDRCPELPADSGLEWRHEQADEPNACHARLPDEYDAWFGIRFGDASSFTRKPGANDEAGTVGGHAVTWQPATGKDGDLPYGEETLFAIAMDGAMVPVHVWINARTADEQRDARGVLRDVRFRGDDGER